LLSRWGVFYFPGGRCRSRLWRWALVVRVSNLATRASARSKACEIEPTECFSGSRGDREGGNGVNLDVVRGSEALSPELDQRRGRNATGGVLGIDAWTPRRDRRVDAVSPRPRRDSPHARHAPGQR